MKIPLQSFININDSVPHRLLSLCYDELSLHELLRLSMIAYVKSVLISFRGIGPRMTFLAEKLKAAVLAQLERADSTQLPILLWALFVMAISIFEGCGEDWLRVSLVQTMSSLGLQTWSATRQVLKAFLWTDVLHGVEGMNLFEQCLREPPSEVGLEGIHV